MYYSAYSDAALAVLAQEIGVSARSAETWCIFDKTAQGAATTNALAVIGLIDPK